jgi:hypothetical protein
LPAILVNHKKGKPSIAYLKLINEKLEIFLKSSIIDALKPD